LTMTNRGFGFWKDWLLVGDVPISFARLPRGRARRRRAVEVLHDDRDTLNGPSDGARAAVRARS
jgi:hypothetical protein